MRSSTLCNRASHRRTMVYVCAAVYIIVWWITAYRGAPRLEADVVRQERIRLEGEGFTFHSGDIPNQIEATATEERTLWVRGRAIAPFVVQVDAVVSADGQAARCMQFEVWVFGWRHEICRMNTWGVC